MLLSFGRHVVESRQWETRVEMMDYLKQFHGEPIILGEDAAQEEEFYSAVVHYEYTARAYGEAADGAPGHLGIGLVSEGMGLKPHLLLLTEQTLAFGFNHHAVGLSVHHRRELFRLSFDTPFRSFMYLEGLKTLLVFNEIGVVAATEKGEELWRYESDVITECTIVDGYLHFQFMDSPPARLRLKDGVLV